MLILFFNWAYIVTFLPVVLTSAVIVYFTNRQRYYYYRNLVLLSFGFALIFFALYPMAPPRFMSQFGFVDAIEKFGPSWYASREATLFYNVFAAVPSLHFGWTTLFAVLFFRTGPMWLKVVGVSYPLLTLLAITITGNHFFLDAVGGVGVILLSYLLYEILIRSKKRFNKTMPDIGAVFQYRGSDLQGQNHNLALVHRSNPALEARQPLIFPFWVLPRGNDCVHRDRHVLTGRGFITPSVSPVAIALAP